MINEIAGRFRGEHVRFMFPTLKPLVLPKKESMVLIYVEPVVLGEFSDRTCSRNNSFFQRNNYLSFEFCKNY